MTPPEGRRPLRPGGRPDGAPDDDGRLSAREQLAIDGAVVRVVRRGDRPLLVGLLVVAAFAVGLLRPWDLVLPASGDREDPAVARGSGDPDGPAPPGPGDSTAGSDAAAGPPVVPPERAPTCGYPSSWRSASIQEWAGANARVWSAAEAVTASGPDDPSIPFHVLASDAVQAIGWCAPVGGEDRPPLAAVGTLFRIRDGVALEVAVDRLEPARPDALGELWLPRPLAPGRRPHWPEGRYVIRLASPSGSYVRYLGLDVGVPRRGEPSAGPSPSGVGSPGGAAAPRSRGGPAFSRARSRAGSRRGRHAGPTARPSGPDARHHAPDARRDRGGAVTPCLMPDRLRRCESRVD